MVEKSMLEEGPVQKARLSKAQEAIDDGNIRALEAIYRETEDDMRKLIAGISVLCEHNQNPGTMIDSDSIVAMKEVALAAIDLAQMSMQKS